MVLKGWFRYSSNRWDVAEWVWDIAEGSKYHSRADCGGFLQLLLDLEENIDSCLLSAGITCIFPPSLITAAIPAFFVVLFNWSRFSSFPSELSFYSFRGGCYDCGLPGDPERKQAEIASFNSSPKRLRSARKKPAEGDELALPPSLPAAALRPFQARVRVGVGKKSKNRRPPLENYPSEQGVSFPQMPLSEERAPAGGQR